MVRCGLLQCIGGYPMAVNAQNTHDDLDYAGDLTASAVSSLQLIGGRTSAIGDWQAVAAYCSGLFNAGSNGDTGIQSSSSVVQFARYAKQLSPFDELLESKLGNARRAIQRLRSDGVPAAILEKLNGLIDAAEEEYPTADIPGEQSLASAAAFLRQHEHMCTPIYSLTPAGNVWLQWRADGGRVTAMQFLANGTANIVGSYPDPAEPWRRGSAALNSSVKTAGALLAASPMRWILG
jgi:hypothetical protein